MLPTVCCCQPVAFMISGNVAPFARFIMAMTSAFLLVRSALGLLADCLARPGFFAGLAFLVGLCAPFRLRCIGRWLIDALAIDRVVAH